MDTRSSTGRLMTREEYLAFEMASPMRHEYVAGEVFAMSGATTRHNLITLNIAGGLKPASKTRGCRVFAEGVKLQVGDDRIYYPDVMVACGQAANVEQIVQAPSLVVEVSSPSTRGTDRREKLEAYRRLPSLRTYLIVSQRRRHVLAYVRGPDDAWVRAEFAGDEAIPLPELGAQLALSAIYDDIDLAPLAVGEPANEDEWEEWEMTET